MSEPSKELETIKEDESSASASSASIVEETPATTTSTAAGKKQANKMASHMIVAGSGAGGGGGALQTPTVGNIIEEEEEEDEETDRKKETTTTTTTETAATEKESKMTEESTAVATTATTTASSQPANPPAPVTFLSNKFVLETVHLDDQGQPITPVASAVPATPNPTPTTTNNTNESTTTASNTNTLAAATAGGGGAEGAAALSSRKSTTSSNGDEEQVEIKVEEGYATRQMDEYFRQTIAAIKEELHRKLENKDEAATGGTATQQQSDHHHHHRGKKPIGFDDEDGDDLGGDKVELTAIDAQAKDADYFCSNCRDSLTSRPKNNRAFIYQNLMGKDKLGSSSTSSSKRDKVTPILVLIGSIVNQFIIEGVCFNYATLLEFIQREFQFSSRLIATLPAALLLAFFLLLAPISIFLSKQFGTRRIAVLGTFISTLSLLICSFFSNFVVFVIFYGIFTGVGLSLIYVPSVLAISKWFMRKRLLANSLTQLGACLGAAIYPICSELLLRRYKLFDTLLILAGVQFNCLVGSMLIRDDDHQTSNSPSNIPAGANKISHAYSTSSAAAAAGAPCCRGAQDAALRRSSKLRATGSSKKSSSSAALLIENEHNNSGSVTSPPAAQPVPGRANRAKIKRGYGSGAYHFHNNYLDASETDSTFSVSTTTAPNYTLKQYWRKFIQTRKSTSNGKKNLFHLIAEEKRKTRTLSKMSLEDGFVITTSNNLLAPNDDSHVIVSRRQKLQHQANSNHDKNSMNPEVTSISATSRATKFFSRIANSLRSLATHASSASTQAVAATASSSSAQQHTNAAAATKELTSSEYSAPHPVVDSSKQNNTTHVQEVNERSPPATIPLMSVFEGPLTTPPATTATQEAGGTSNPTGNDSPPLSDGDEDSIGGGEDVMQDEDELDEDEMDETGVDEEGGASMDGGEDDDDDEDDEDSAESASARVHRHSSQISAALKNQRYLTYRASLANSVRGSLMECSVPEEKEKRRKSAGGGSEHGEDEAQPKEDDTGGESNLDDTQSVIEQRRRARKVRTSSFVAARQQQNKLTTPTPINSTAYTTHVNALSGGASGPTKTNRVNIQPRENQETVGYAKPTIHNLRRFISTMETGSFYNVPLNLEPIEYNLKNSLTKCFAENYRRQHKNMRKSVYQKKYNLILYLDYLSYLTSFKLFLNPILFVLNASFFLHSAALASLLVHVSEYAVRRTLTSEKPITREQSIQVLGLLGLTCGLGRLVSTVAYKVNASNIKSRIFAYVLTVLLAGIVVLSSTLLCDTYFSFCMFAITFGVLTGFNLNLRTVMIYDMMALEWSDDSLFCFTLFSQAIGIFIGLPIASLLYDIFNDETFVFYYAGALFILSAILLMPGRKIRSYSYSSYKSLNKFYLQRRFN